MQSDKEDITPGQEKENPTLHREGLSSSVEVPSTRGSRKGELLLQKKPPQSTYRSNE